MVARQYRRLGSLTLACGVILILAAGLGSAQAPAQSVAASIRVQPSPEIAGVIAGGTQPQVIATGLMGADDPIWLPGVGLVFTEPNANRIVRLLDGDTLTTFVGGLRAPLGMTVDREGRLISLQSAAGFTGVRVVWPPGKEAVLAERFQGLPFSRPNGIVSDRKGGVYLSDPGLAPPQEAELRKTQKRLPPAVYYVPRGGEPIQVADGIARPNGVHLSRDEKTLYVNDTNGIQSFAFDVLSDGRLSNPMAGCQIAASSLPMQGGLLHSVPPTASPPAPMISSSTTTVVSTRSRQRASRYSPKSGSRSASFPSPVPRRELGARHWRSAVRTSGSCMSPVTALF